MKKIGILNKIQKSFVRRKALRTCYSHVYKHVPNFVRPANGLQLRKPCKKEFKPNCLFF